MRTIVTHLRECEDCGSLIKIELQPPENIIVDGETLDWADFECEECGYKNTVSLLKLKEEADML